MSIRIVAGSRERLNLFTPLGIRFWDPVYERQVRDGLLVTAYAADDPGSGIPAFRTAAGVYAFQRLPGLHDLVYRGESPPEARSFLVSVADRQQRFLPVVFSVELPLPYRGLFLVDALSSPLISNPPGFYLFSAPGRVPGSGLAVLRAQLYDQASRGAAAYAVLEMHLPDGTAWYGLADERGTVTLLCPYPSFLSSPGTSPPVPNPMPLNQQNWPVQIRVRYAPDMLVPTALQRPELASILRQPAGLIWPHSSDPPDSEWAGSLIYGQELQIQTDGLPPDESPRLLISPQTSPP